MTTYSADPTLYLFTSLTAGSSHIVTATSRLETILRANRVPFRAVDIATDDKARMLWGRRAGKDESGRLRKLPGLVQEGLVLGDLTEVEDWNEFGELKQRVKIHYDEHTIPPIQQKPQPPPQSEPPASKAVASPVIEPLKSATDATDAPVQDSHKEEKEGPSSTKAVVLPLRTVADEAARKAKELRLNSLRQKVHSSKPVSQPAPELSSPNEPPLSVDTSENAGPSETLSIRQSSESCAWEASSPIDHSSVQSPTSGRWLRDAAGSNTPLTYRGATVALASEAEIQRLESETAIKEEPELEEAEERKDEMLHSKSLTKPEADNDTVSETVEEKAAEAPGETEPEGDDDKDNDKEKESGGK